MNSQEIETIYEDLALALDTVAPEHRELFLAKLALLFAREIGDLEVARAHVKTACLDLGK
jgi:hypothetical protein